MSNSTLPSKLNRLSQNLLTAALMVIALSQTHSLNAGDPRTDPRARAERNQAAEKAEAESKAKRFAPCSKCDHRHSEIRRNYERQNQVTISHLSPGAYLDLIAKRCNCPCHD